MTGDLSDKVWYNVIIHSFSVFTDRKRHLLEVCLCEQLYSAYPAQVLMLIMSRETVSCEEDYSDANI